MSKEYAFCGEDYLFHDNEYTCYHLTSVEFFHQYIITCMEYECSRRLVPICKLNINIFWIGGYFKNRAFIYF